MTAFGKRRAPAVSAEAKQGTMMRLDQEADLVVDPADQRVEDVDREVDDRLAIGALQMRVRIGSFSAGRWQGQVIDRG